MLRVVGAKDDLNPLPLKIVEPDDEFGAHPEPVSPDQGDVAAEVPVVEQISEATVQEYAMPEEVPEEQPAEVSAEASDKDRHAKTKRDEELADLEI